MAPASFLGPSAKPAMNIEVVVGTGNRLAIIEFAVRTEC
jgi:hypothetical protein